MDIRFTDNTEMFKDEFEAALLRALEKCGLIAEDYAKRLAPVITGNLRNSISHRVDSDEPAVYVGTNSEYAAYVELGTGKYAQGGRQDPWTYQDDEGNWHRTEGRKAKPYLKPAVADHAQTYRSIIEDELKNG